MSDEKSALNRRDFLKIGGAAGFTGLLQLQIAAIEMQPAEGFASFRLAAHDVIEFQVGDRVDGFWPVARIAVVDIG